MARRKNGYIVHDRHAYWFFFERKNPNKPHIDYIVEWLKANNIKFFIIHGKRPKDAYVMAAMESSNPNRYYKLEIEFLDDDTVGVYEGVYSVDTQTEKETLKTSKYSSLKEYDEVVCYVDPEHEGKDKVYDGNVISVDLEKKFAWVCYLYGYKSHTDAIPFDKMIAKGDKAGDCMTFGRWISGPSALLIP